MPTTQSQSRFGINLFGSVTTKDGIGRAALLNAQALQIAQVPVEIYPLARPFAIQASHTEITPEITDELLQRVAYGINLCQFSSRWTETYWAGVSPEQRARFYNIGFWFCEVPEIPESWAQNLRFYDEIWTASAFCQNAIARVSTCPVLSFPLPFEPFIEDTCTKRPAPAPLRFLFVSNCYSDAERKNALGTLRAFRSAFGACLDVQLTLKLSNLEYAPRLEAALRCELEGVHNVTLETGYVSDNDIATLYYSHHIYVSLHRAEGYGLTISDALRYGMPVICTGYSGNMEFCHMPGVQLVDYELRRIGHERLRYLADHIWAYPKPDSAISAFRHMATHYETERRAACASAQTLAKRLSMGSIGEMMHRRLDLIHRRFAYRNDMASREIVRDFDIYDA